jgi:arginyl-tRNA synthetase
VSTEIGVAARIAERIVEAVQTEFGLTLTPGEALVRPSVRGRDADYQSSIAMRVGKQLARNPFDVAERIARSISIDGLLDARFVTPPGFINFVVSGAWLDEAAAAMAADARLGVPLPVGPRTVVIDYSAPNIAKEMHVGHLRSTIIGDALARVTAFLGDHSLAQNHVGDWGTPFGMLLEHLCDQEWDASSEHHIADLNVFYQAARERFDNERGFADRARARVVSLQSEEPATLALWQQLIDESTHHFNAIYGALDVPLTDADLAGESMYRAALDGVVDDLLERGIAVIADGAACVFPDGFTGREGQPLPLILRKRDGGYTYGATDLAAIRHRVDTLGADDILYVVGAPQHLHLEMVYASARLAGWLPDSVTARHVAFGSVLGEDGKMLRTRAGATIKLIDLVTEATRHAAAALEARSPDVDDRDALARAIGIGAIKYADLSTDREKDYVFSFDRMLALEGNTSVYLQYANARARSMLRRAGADLGALPVLRIAEPAERALAMKLLDLPRVLDEVASRSEPHRLCGYLYETAAAFSSFYNDCPVIGAENPAVRDSRLALTRLTSRVITRGLDLLGIAAPERL